MDYNEQDDDILDPEDLDDEDGEEEIVEDMGRFQ